MYVLGVGGYLPRLRTGKEASVDTAVEDEVWELTAEEIIYDHKGH